MASSDSDMGDEVYQPDESEVQDDAGVLEPEDTLVDRGVASALDEGYSPPEKPLGAESYGTTAAEQREGEPLDERLSRETPEAEEAEETATVDERADEDVIDDEPPDTVRTVGDGSGAEPSDEEFLEAELEGERAGRLVAPDEGAHADEEKDEVGADVGIDGAAASAEEAAVRITPEPGPP